ncbi:exodeoxyribonuclease VII small subunit [bacterium]|nr:exodeoxyribonuclease VII small subunit [bacterium]
MADEPRAATGKAKPDPGPKSGEKSFEDAFQRLETIVEEMEQDDLPLEDLLKRFEEGIALVKNCRAFLNRAQAKVEEFVEEKNGQWVLKDID